MMDHGRDQSLSPDISRLSGLLQRNPASRLFVPLAEAHLKAANRDEAIRILTEGIGHHPTFVAARVMLGKIYVQMEAWEKAKAQFEKAIETNSENIPSLKNLGSIYQKEGGLEEALVSYRTILRVDPGDKEARCLFVALEEEISKTRTPEVISNNFETSSDSPLSVLELESVKSSSPSSLIEDKADDEASDERICEIGRKADKILAEKPEGEASSVLEPEEEESQKEALKTPTLASIYMSQGCYQEAVDIYRDLLARNPDDIESRNGLEKALSGLADPEGAEPVLASAGASRLEAEIARLEDWLHVIQAEKKQ